MADDSLASFQVSYEIGGAPDALAEAARADPVCLGCNGYKPHRCIVCWSCWKYRKDVVPFKYYTGGTLREWLTNEVKRVVN
jgi:hypothetical protein